ncbi:gamma-glutamyl-gamma-aminobutyrate hydrolase family protein [Humisphaera borealis]|nr:gamma-glutamyl-gamma-aminobutyrate hydrolase family protein [Humisphaera borealis]
MKRPVIGITIDSRDDKPSRYEIPSDYARSVERAGGLPVMLPFRAELSLIPELLDILDGIVLIGGNDLDPALYGETWHPKTERLDAQRQTFELALIAEVERRKLPALGICLGSQVMNVHRGGSLHQFLPDFPREGAIEHRSLGNDSYRHPVQIEPGTMLEEIVGTGSIIANSRHKQGVNRLGRGLRVNATAPDGVIEGFEDPSLPFFVAIQWHPENLTATDPAHLRIFERLVSVARSRVAT